MTVSLHGAETVAVGLLVLPPGGHMVEQRRLKRYQTTKEGKSLNKQK